MGLLIGCNSNQTADQFLKDDLLRKEIIVSIVHHQPYMTEMLHEMMNNDSSKLMLTQSMMSNPSMKTTMMDNMMKMCETDSVMCKLMMSKMMIMCEADQSKCKMMIFEMQSHPKLMQCMKEKGDLSMVSKNNGKHKKSSDDCKM